MPDGISNFEDAVSAALAEIDAPEGEVVEVAEEETPEPAVASEPEGELFADDAEIEVADQPASEATDDPDEIFGDVEVAGTPVSVSDDLEITDLVGVDHPVTLGELKRGYLRQADYTRKTQEVAEARKANADAVQFFEYVQENPLDAVKALASKLGINLGDANFDAKNVPLLTTAEVEEEVTRRLEAAVAEHPLVVQSRQSEAQRVIDAEFDRIAAKYGQPLGPKSRENILAKVRQLGAQADDALETVFLSMLAERERKQASKDTLRAAAPSAPGRGASSVDEEDGIPFEKPSTFEEAQANAEWELRRAG